MTTQANFMDDELDLGVLDSGTKKKFSKILSVPKGKSTFRILPAPSGKKPFVEHWYQWFKFNVTGEDGEVKTFWATGKAADANNPLRTKLAAVVKRMSELDAAYSTTSVSPSGQTNKKVDEKAMPADVQKEYAKLKGAKRYLTSARHVFANAATLDGSHVILRMPKTAYELLKKEIVRLKAEGETLNALSLSDSTKPAEGKTVPSFGVWFDFERTGEALQTKYTVKVRKSRQKVEVNGKTLIDEQFDHTPLSEEIQNNYANMVIDLETVIDTYTNEELLAILKGDKSIVDKKRGFSARITEQPPQEVAGDLTEGLSLGDDEITGAAAEDDIPTIDL